MCIQELGQSFDNSTEDSLYGTVCVQEQGQSFDNSSEDSLYADVISATLAQCVCGCAINPCQYVTLE